VEEGYLVGRNREPRCRDMQEGEGLSSRPIASLV
jgi:hypothetical protein